MCPCDVLDVNIDPTGPSGPTIPGFGQAFSLNDDSIVDFLDGMPEDLLELLDELSLLIPPGALTPALNPNFGKDVFDAILKLVDQFMPFLMLYKFFIPILNMIICILEVICAMNNPFKVIRAIRRLFRNCIPAFLNLFPIFALIIMIISLLLLLLALIAYIIEQILKLIDLILRNLRALQKAISDGDANSILAITTKIGALLCFFQNLFVLLSVFSAIFQIFRDMLRLASSIPPCDSDSGDTDGCCTPDVCPSIVLADYTRSTGSLQYHGEVTVDSGLSLPSFYGSSSLPVRSEGWFIYDAFQTQPEEFINIVDAYDIPNDFGPKPNFYPTDGVYNKDSDVRYVPYAIDLKVFYNPANWGRTGEARYVEFKDCVAIAAPTRAVESADGYTQVVTQGVLQIEGGVGYEEDGSALFGFADDGITLITERATINNFLHKENRDTTTGQLLATDGYLYSDSEYTFKPNFEYLFAKQLVTAGCEPSLSLDKSVINNAYAGDIGVMTEEINNILNTPSGSNADGVGFPDPQGAIDSLGAALDAFRENMTVSGAGDFAKASQAILSQMSNDTNWALGEVAISGISPCDSTVKVSETIQFNTKPIIVTVSLNERNGESLVRKFPEDTAKKLANMLIGYVTFGKISRFSYDGESAFTAEITADDAGSGILTVAFDNEFLCINNIPEDLDIEPSIDIQEVDFEFVHVTHTGSPIVTGEGQPRRDGGDVARDGSDQSGE